jgi:hypothetical protein
MKLKILLALLAAIAAYYFGWGWLLVFPLILLFGANGSRWLRVDYIPNESDHRGIVYFNKDGEHYRNSQGETYHMVERGKDTWASPGRWKGGKR